MGLKKTQRYIVPHVVFTSNLAATSSGRHFKANNSSESFLVHCLREAQCVIFILSGMGVRCASYKATLTAQAMNIRLLIS